MPVGWHPERKARVSNKARIINITPASASPNWDGTWWQVEWSDGERDQVTITAHRNDHGLGYCRSEARRVALALRQAREAK